MRKKSVLALLAFATFAAAVVVGMGASAAFAGERTGNCNNAKPGSAAADNCKKGQNENSNSICSFSGQNDDPNGLDPENGPGGTSQSYGQQNKLGISDPSTENPGKVGQGVRTAHPGYACNGDHGFFAGG